MLSKMQKQCLFFTVVNPFGKVVLYFLCGGCIYLSVNTLMICDRRADKSGDHIVRALPPLSVREPPPFRAVQHQASA